MILLDPLARPVIGHRGASGRFPENTMLSFREALRAGADGVEFDVRLTEDGVPVVIHDPTLDRTTDGEGVVAELPLAAIQEHDAGAGERVPILADVLEDLGSAAALIEIKDPRAGPAVVAAIGRAGAKDRVLVGAFTKASIEVVRAAAIPSVATRWEFAVRWGTTRVGAVHRHVGYVAFSVPEYYHGLSFVDERFTSSVRRLGMPVHVWTVDDVESAARLRRIGVAGILTNFPDRMLS